MLLDYKLGQTSIVLRVKIRDSTVSTGAGKTGLTSASSGLIISTIADNESTATAYTVAGSNVETISTLGTFASPTASKCRFKEVDSTNHKGIYEIQIADARFAVSSAKSLLISVSGVTGAAECDVVIPLRQVNPYDAVRGGMTALPNAAADAAGGLPISDAGGLDLDAQRSDVAAILVDTGTTLDARIPAALVSGRMDASVGAYQSGLTPLQPTTAGRTLDVTATGAAGIDWANVENPTTSVALTGTTIATTQKVDVETIKTQSVTCAAGVTVGAFVGQGTAAIGVNASGHVSRVVLCDTITTYTGDTPQTGDSYAIVNSGTHGNAAIKGYVDDIGTAGAGLTAVPWNAAWDAEVQSECADALTAFGASTLTAAQINTEADAALADVGLTTTITGRIDAAISTRLASASYTAPLDAAGVRTAVGLASANLDTQIAAVKSDTAATLLDTGTDGVVVASGSKTGYSLSSTGLDSVATTAPSGVASNFREMLVQVWRRFFRKSTLTSTQLKTYADDGSTVITTQTVSDDGTTQTQGTSS